MYLACELSEKEVRTHMAVIKGLAYLVGLTINAPISFFLSLVFLRMSISIMGITNARVFPEPVTASTMTSLCRMKSGIVEAWTGVICVWPID
jgi:hypothetical protein